ncbi:MAG TPA: EAL domain-containing protein [Gemmatimonas sp.]|nr:EAL domain-containing protein [Gemmatimonas sp.]
MSMRPALPCRRCESLPATATQAADLHLWFPTPHVAAKAREIFASSNIAPTRSVGGGFCYHMPAEERVATFEKLELELSLVEREDTRVLAVDAGVEPTSHDLARVESLARLVGRMRHDWLLAMLEERRLTSHFQPIALASDPGLTYGHEALLRGVLPDGSLIAPTRLFDAARESGLLFQLDLAARRSAIAAAHSHGLRGALFINFAPTAIYDPAACLRTTVAAIDAAGIPRSCVVFEIVETERAQDTNHLRRILDYYRGAGFRIALDDVGSGYSSLNLIHLLRPDILKLDMELVRGVDQDPYKARIAANLLDVAGALGIETLAEGIETEGELAWARENGATYVQGYLLGRPAPAPAHFNGANYAPRGVLAV